MARESAASLSMLPVQAMQRLAPPAGLERSEVDLFLAVVNSKPAEWFGPDSAPLLVEYVRAQTMCDHLDALVKAALAGGEAKEVKAAMQLRDMESKRLLQLGTKMRLTQQSRYTPQASATAQKHATGGTKLWQRQPQGAD